MNISELKDFIISCLENKKAKDIVVMDFTNSTLLADYLIFASGYSSKSVKSMSEYLMLEMKKISLSAHIEGLELSKWVLIDCCNIITNIFGPDIREHYSLEELWKQRAIKIYKHTVKY